MCLFLLLVFAALEDEATADYKRKFITLEFKIFKTLFLLLSLYSKYFQFPKFLFLLLKTVHL